MDVNQVLEIGREAIWVLIKMSAPLMLIALTVGLAVSLFQALTQIQEMTLTFVPKMLAIFLATMLLMPFMYNELAVFSEHLTERIVGLD